MELPDNILRFYLKNVYFISGSACGGKTTISRHLSKKFGIELYNWDERYAQHKEISDLCSQPFMNRKIASWEEHFSKPPEDQSVKKSMMEQAEIALVELISLSADKKIIVDGIFPCDVLRRVSSTGRVVFLMAEIGAIRKDFFDRADKQDMLRCIERLRDPQKAKENVFRSIEYSLDRDLEDVKRSGFWYLVRSENTAWERIVDAVEHQLELA